MQDRTTITLNAGKRPTHQPRKLNGHDFMLQHYKSEGKVLNVGLMSGGRASGRLLNFDKFTVTIEGADQSPVCIFKHAIEFIS